MKLAKMCAKAVALLLCVSCATLSVISYSVADTLSDAEAEKKKLQNKRKELQSMMSELEVEQADIMANIEKFDKQMNKLASEMNELEEEIDAKNDLIKNLEEKIDAASIEIENQYEVMKKRIKYMYENGSSGYMDVIMSAKSLSDLLSRSEYVEKMSQYDSLMFKQFVSDKEELESKKAQLKQEKKAIVTSRKELKLEKQAIDEMSRKKTAELEEYKANIKDTESQIETYNDKLEQQEKIIEAALLEQQRRIAEEERRKAEEAARKAAELAAQQAAQQANQNVNPVVVPTANPANVTGFVWPLSIKGKITSYFGNRTSPTAGASSYHQGIDVGAAAGTPILAANGGTVVTASYSSAAGNYVMINHGNGVFTVYMHASSLAVSVNQQVTKGQTIAYVGSTGISTGAHLHFGVSVGGKYVNPLDYVSQ